MLDRLNFYDLYAYLLPGLVWLVLAALPYAAFSGRWPSEALLSALAGVTAGYVLGHVLYQASRGIPLFAVKRKDRLDSQIVLDVDDKTFSAAMKKRIRARAIELFDVDPDAEGAPAERDRARQDAFKMARALLGRRKQAFYAEQFQGMYALARGLAGACFLGAAAYAGFGAWHLLGARSHLVKPALAVLVIAFGAIVLWKKTRDWGWVACLFISMAILGGRLAWMAGRTSSGMFLVAAGVFAIGWMFLPVQRRFQSSFAQAIWEGLAVTEPREPGPKSE